MDEQTTNCDEFKLKNMYQKLQIPKKLKKKKLFIFVKKTFLCLSGTF